MKTIRTIVAALAAFIILLAIAAPASAAPLPKGDNELRAGSTLQFTGGKILSGTTEVGVPFTATATITSAAAATAVTLIPDSAVPPGKKVYVTGFVGKVNGATLWATTASVKIQDSNGTPVDYFTMLVAALTANAEVRPGTTNVTSEAAYNLGTGGTAAKGLRLKGNANGTGSSLVVTVTGYIK